GGGGRSPPRGAGANRWGAAAPPGGGRCPPCPEGAGARARAGSLAPACNGRRDGWKGTTYLNASGFIDPPTCTTPTNGLVLLRIKDRRGSGRGITVQAKTKLSTFPVPIGPLGVAVAPRPQPSGGAARWGP